MQSLLQDIRFGLRMLRSRPGFTVAAVLTLALGIAANTTIFSAVNGWMLRPPRIKHPSGVVVVVSVNPARQGWEWDRNPISVPDFIAWREQNTAFEDIVASEWDDFAITGEGEPERLAGERVSANYFDVLGVSAAMGRTFLPDEDKSGHDRVVILSNGLWQRRFASNPGVIGQVVRLNGESHTVVGVTPANYRMGVYGPQLWAPMVFSPESLLPAAREHRRLHAMARLKPGVSIETAKAEIATLAQRAEQTNPGTSRGWGGNVITIQQYIADEFKVAMRLLIAVVLFVLLIACANIASLQLTRAAERQREFAIRAALGASRFRLVRQLMVESLLIALAGATLGLLLASWGVDLFRSGLNWSDYVRSMALELTIDYTVLAYTFSLSFLAAILSGLAPTFYQTRLDLNSTLREGSRTGSQGRTRNRAQSVLVTAEISLAVALLVGAGILIQGFHDGLSAGFGINPNQVSTAHISLSSTTYKDASKQAAFFQEALRRLETLPGVISAGATNPLVPSGTESERAVTISISGQVAVSRAERARTVYFVISPDYLRTLRIPLIRGRTFLPSDNAQSPPVALVNHAFVRRFFPDEQPLGKHIRLDTDASDRPDWSEIVGVVGDVQDPAGERRKPQVYEPYLQRPSSAMTLAVRTTSDPAAFATILRRTVWGIDKDQPISRVQTMHQAIADYVAGGVVVNSLMGVFATLGLALAAVGVFGVMAYTVVQRTHEIGIRMALGAQKSDVLRMVVRKGMILGAFGVGIGLVLAAPLIWLPIIPEDVMPPDRRALVFLAAASVIWLAAFLASYIPARRATRVDPMVALRFE